MEEIKYHRHIETREGLCDTQKLPANIPPLPHVQTIRTHDPEQNRAYKQLKNTSSRKRQDFALESHVQVNC